MTAAMLFIGNNALLIAWVLVAASAAFCALVAWINRPLWMRLALARLSAWVRRFRGAI